MDESRLTRQAMNSQGVITYSKKLGRGKKNTTIDVHRIALKRSGFFEKNDGIKMCRMECTEQKIQQDRLN